MKGAGVETVGRRGSQARVEEGGRYLGIPQNRLRDAVANDHLGDRRSDRGLFTVRKPGAVQDVASRA